MQSFFMGTTKTDRTGVAHADLSSLGTHGGRYIFTRCGSDHPHCLLPVLLKGTVITFY